MNPKSYYKISALLTASGVLFAGYLSAVKLFSRTCPFNESCQYFLGYPACWFGLAMFLSMFVISLIGLFSANPRKIFPQSILAIAGAGIIFAGRFVISEIIFWQAGGHQEYQLIFPTCAYGLIFYILIFFLSWRQLKKKIN